MEVTTLAAKDPDVNATYTIRWIGELIDELQRETAYVLGAIVRPVRFEGYYLECTTAGETSRYAPAIPRAAAETVADGSAIWTARHPDDVTVPSVQSAAWTVPTGLTLVTQSETAVDTHITIAGGVDGQDYELTCRMTPTSGNPQDRTFVVPVRSL